ncbi:inactive protein RESTRICTED TEV MOVEMENT 1-like [Chenopodium quinoa]|uniref:inactive protein RESTRICTED TEV MOVEMENT 1-like n=1 Tax=Chenopodium quinoa TaxID=63459 RepID=UPI000B77D840|nr:inactive protein RESTRICTED TEV MOVEMENT 1-like [Chenopodium quinoa]
MNKGTKKGLVKLGPIGKRSNKTWDEKGRYKITGIFISYEDSHVNCLQFQYEDNCTNLVPEFGRHTGSKFSTVIFDYKFEYITGLSGNYSPSEIKSMTIKTNRKKYGPFGSKEELNTKFNFEFGPSNRFGGFYGTYSTNGRITSIGVYVKPGGSGLGLCPVVYNFSPSAPPMPRKL